MKVIFLGTPDFALPSLEALINSKHEVVAVVTQCDQPSGRGNKVVSPPVKTMAEREGIRVFQFEKIRTKEAIEALTKLDADIMVTAAYGQILSKRVLGITKRGVINVHASLLPKYRGAAPIQWAVICGEKTTGVTIMQTDVGVDTGDIILKRELKVNENETSGELFIRLAKLGGGALVEALDLIEEGRATFLAQDHSEATHFPMLRKTDGEIDWSLSAHQIACKIRGVNPWPSAYTYLDNRIIKIWGAREGVGASKVVGEVLVANPKEGLTVACGEGVLHITELQREGGKRMEAREFLKGFLIPVGTVFTKQL